MDRYHKLCDIKFYKNGIDKQAPPKNLITVHLINTGGGSRDVPRGRDNERTVRHRNPVPVKKVFLCIFAFILHTIHLLVCKTGSYGDSLCE